MTTEDLLRTHNIARCLSVFAAACVVLCSTGCDQPSEYDRMVQRELAKGVTFNELFLGYEFGMPRDSFYNHSWELNRQGLVVQGPANRSVQYELDDELPGTAKMLFYPEFHEDRIFQMRVRYLYDGWAPWTRHLSSDSLQMDVIDLYREWYGDGFIELTRTRESFGENVHYVKVDGNRQIVVTRGSDRDVVAVFTDLLTAKRIEDERNGRGDGA